MVVDTYVLLGWEYRVWVLVRILGMRCSRRTYTQGMNHMMNRAVRECDTMTTRKYRAESLIRVSRRVGQVDLAPYVE